MSVHPLASVHPSATVALSAEIEAFATIGKGCKVWGGTHVGIGATMHEDSVLSYGFKLGAHATLLQGVVCRRDVEPGETISI